MLVLQCWGAGSTIPLFSCCRRSGSPPRASFSNSLCHNSVIDIADVIHNRVLVAAAVSGAIGQVMKPFTSALFYRKHFDFKTAFQSGGFPSTHSSAVVATATSLGLERGFADAIFGLAVVYAFLVMYDSQGVRREVGTHAKTLNRFLPKALVNSTTKVSNGSRDAFPRKSSKSLQLGIPIFFDATNDRQREEKDSLLLDSNPELISTSAVSDVSDSYAALKESVGHTEIEVIAGALLGFVVSLAVCIV